MFTSLEGSIQAMEESKCFEKYRIISEDLGQLKIQFQKYHQYSNHIRHQMYVVRFVYIADHSLLSTETKKRTKVICQPKCLCVIYSFAPGHTTPTWWSCSTNR